MMIYYRFVGISHIYLTISILIFPDEVRGWRIRKGLFLLMIYRLTRSFPIDDQDL
jgi:hypothetical protein